MRLYIGLLHYPVYNKNDQKIASAITNLDLHDLSRLARSYNVKRFFVITPLEEQQQFAKRIIDHWLVGYGSRYNKYRKEAMELIEVIPSFDESVRLIIEVEGEKPLILATDASQQDKKSITYTGAINLLNSDKTVFLIFGTAWGLHQDVLDEADFILEPVQGNADYNHLSVRTAAGIILDRLAGKWR